MTTTNNITETLVQVVENVVKHQYIGWAENKNKCELIKLILDAKQK